MGEGQELLIPSAHGAGGHGVMQLTQSFGDVLLPLHDRDVDVADGELLSG